MKRRTCRTTLLELVQTVQDQCASDAEVIAVITHLVNTRRVMLCGSFARMRIAAA
jgi:hypothetical protein